MPSRKTLLLLTAYLLLVAATFLYVWGRTPGPCITEGNAGRIREGMTEDQVVQILGVPAGDYTSKTWGCDPEMCTGVFDLGEIREESRLSWKEWVGDQGMIRVGFDESAVVRRAKFRTIFFWQETPIELLRRLLKRLGLG
jgi:hypothetical protein